MQVENGAGNLRERNFGGNDENCVENSEFDAQDLLVARAQTVLK